MPRVVVVWCPDWPVAAAGAPPGSLTAVIHANRVVACSPAAQSEGVHPGLRRREAQSRCPELELLAHDPARDARAFEPVLVAVEQLTPWVEVLHPGECAFPARGAARYHGGEPSLVATLTAAVHAALGGRATCQVGIADGTPAGPGPGWRAGGPGPGWWAGGPGSAWPLTGPRPAWWAGTGSSSRREAAGPFWLPFRWPPSTGPTWPTCWSASACAPSATWPPCQGPTWRPASGPRAPARPAWPPASTSIPGAPAAPRPTSAWPPSSTRPPTGSTWPPSPPRPWPTSWSPASTASAWPAPASASRPGPTRARPSPGSGATTRSPRRPAPPPAPTRFPAPPPGRRLSTPATPRRGWPPSWPSGSAGSSTAG